MNDSYLKILGLSLGLTVMAQTGHTAAIKDTTKPIQSLIVVVDKQSPIEKALNQQKRGENKLISDKDQLKVLTSIKTTASQNLSHIHISRCPRIRRCRSPWSQYH